MSSIDELLSRLAPDGVQHRALQEVGSFVRGGGPQKKDFSDEGVGCIHYGQIYTHYGIHTSTTLSHVSPEVAARSRRAQPGDVIIAVTGENDADLARAVAWLGNAPVAVSNHTLIYTSSLDPKYVSLLPPIFGILGAETDSDIRDEGALNLGSAVRDHPHSCPAS
ncbi:hypothetical protein GCM10025789_15630 [Tessaracoccus lubricantis]|uniref:SIS domain-containing protein n=1 Tax=Tessaracoccus lubricantis TaxID=545543 RepID=A0ABP9FCI8_9ACTN